MKTLTSVVLVHGSMHGPWCWDALSPLLEAQGLEVLTPDVPSLAAERNDAGKVTFDMGVSSVLAAIQCARGHVLLLGHSAGGAVISQAAETAADKVSGLMYLAAFLPVNGESLLDMTTAAMRHAPLSGSEVGWPAEVDGAYIFDPETAARIFFSGCRLDVSRRAVARLRPQPKAPLAAPLRLTPARFGAIAKSYVVCTHDQAFPPAAQEHLCRRTPGVTRYELNADHSPFLSDAHALAGIIDREAQRLAYT